MSDKPEAGDDMTGKSTLTPEEQKEKWLYPPVMIIGNKVIAGGPKTPEQRRNAEWMDNFLKAHRARRRNRI
jgi:hypothetical protein